MRAKNGFWAKLFQGNGTDASCCSSKGDCRGGEKGPRAACSEDIQGESAERGPSIVVLGSGCASCHALLENTRAAVERMGIAATVEYVTDARRIAEYGVMSVPALVVSGRVVSAGKVLKPADVERLLKGNLEPFRPAGQ